jgi:hypothetical protein
MVDEPFEHLPNPLTKGPSSRPMRSQGYEQVPGPGRRWDKRHFAQQEGNGCILMLLVTAGSVWFLGYAMGLWQALFG